MRRYGPPRLEHAPTVTVGHPQSRQGERDVPQPRALVEQRRQINALAYLAALEAREDTQ
ncbi:MAG TPA: hypothetical protein VIR33_11695 [Thermopolyspora sp.]|jgi:hypothetical protein